MPTVKPLRIDYGRVLVAAPSRDYAGSQEFLSGALPYAWLDEYTTMMPHQPNVHRIPVGGNEYLRDLSSELVEQGIVPARHSAQSCTVRFRATGRCTPPRAQC